MKQRHAGGEEVRRPLKKCHPGEWKHRNTPYLGRGNNVKTAMGKQGSPRGWARTSTVADQRGVGGSSGGEKMGKKGGEKRGKKEYEGETFPFFSTPIIKYHFLRGLGGEERGRQNPKTGVKKKTWTPREQET